MTLSLFRDGPEYQHRKETPFKPTNVTLAEIHSVVPKELHEKDTLKASLYAIQDITCTVIVYRLGWLIDSFAQSLACTYGLPVAASTAVKWSLWGLYWHWQGVILAGWWCLAHEAGHGSLSPYSWFNHAVGFSMHTDCCREALVWRQLNHPNVLPFLGVNVDLFAPSFCLISPWMSNGNLMQFLQRNPDFDRRNAITDIAAAMEYLHGYSPPIVHADIRGANVLVRDDLRCCLADFGLSSVTTSFTLTSSTGNGGSIRWLAPESFMISVDGDENRSKSTSRDTYASVCAVLEVYTGQSPFPQYKFDPPVMYDVLAGKRPPRPPRLSNELWMLVESCWQQDPARRSCTTFMSMKSMSSLEFFLIVSDHHYYLSFVGLPPSWTVSSMGYDFSEDKISAIHSRHSPASNRPFLWQSTAPRPSENHLQF
ncbi:kinase-like domain-containing protein [Mycena floridula]|nr:kinase-like domain-containing protein [Mycena floridula]